MNATHSLPIHKMAWAFLSALVFFFSALYLWDWPMEMAARCLLLVPIAVGAVLMGYLLQFVWKFFVAAFPKSACRRPLKQRIVVWLVRAAYISVLLAAIDSWSAHCFRHGVVSVTMGGLKDGGTRMSVGPGYFMTFWRRMDGKAYGPEIWFWFTPFVIDAAHGGIRVRWIWTR